MRCGGRQAGTSAMLPLQTSTLRVVSQKINWLASNIFWFSQHCIRNENNNADPFEIYKKTQMSLDRYRSVTHREEK
jgi:hypothetical protein